MKEFVVWSDGKRYIKVDNNKNVKYIDPDSNETKRVEIRINSSWNLIENTEYYKYILDLLDKHIEDPNYVNMVNELFAQFVKYKDIRTDDGNVLSNIFSLGETT